MLLRQQPLTVFCNKGLLKMMSRHRKGFLRMKKNENISREMFENGNLKNSRINVVKAEVTEG